MKNSAPLTGFNFQYDVIDQLVVVYCFGPPCKYIVDLLWMIIITMIVINANTQGDYD